MDGSNLQRVDEHLSDSFELAYSSLFGGLHEKGTMALPNDETLNKWREIFNSLSTDGNDVGSHRLERVPCLQCTDDSLNSFLDEESTIVMENKVEYDLLKSLEILGNAFLKDRHYGNAYKCYSWSHAYYVGRFDHVHVKSRDVKREIARVLLEWGRYEEAIRELRLDAQMDVYGSALEAEATLHIKYTYGRSLLAMNLTLEAVPFLYPYYLGQMNTENEENMEVLKAVTWKAHEYLVGERVDFAISMTKRLMNIFSMRLHQGDCPARVFEFVASFSGYLRLVGKEERLIEIYKAAYEIHSIVCNADTNLLLSAIGCSFPEGSPYFKVSMEAVALLHNHLLTSVRDNEIRSLKRLMVTINLVHVWAGREEAIKILLEAYSSLFLILDRNGPEYNIIHDCLMERIHSPE